MAKSKSKNKGGFVRKLLLGINILLVFLLLLSYCAQYISPASYWVFAFLGISYPIILLGNLFFIILWLFIRFKFALISFIAITIGYSCLLRTIQYSSKTPESELKDATKIMSFNVRNFDLYNYDFKNNWAYNFTKRNKIFDLLGKEEPDIACLQEFVYDATNTFKTTDTLKNILGTKNAHIVLTTNSRNLNYFGIATFTKYPIADTGSIAFKTVSGNICIFTDVIIGKDTVRIYNAHFESIRLGYEDYQFASELSENNIENTDIKNRSRKILSRLKKAYIIRAPQVDLVAEHMITCPYPIIFCGDFNDTPISYAYYKIAKNLKDSFLESGRGTGQSYVGVFPSFRIDYILHSPLFQAHNYETIHQELSDHYPIKCYLKKKE